MGTWTGLAKGTLRRVINPGNTFRSLLSMGERTVLLGGAGYVGWEKLTTDKSVARIVSEAAIGKDTVDMVTGAAEDISSLKENAGEALDKVNSTLSGVDSGMNGIKKFFTGLFSGNGGNMLGDFFSNLGSGKVSGLGIAGLIGAALLVFGRFGWFGKIAGALLSMFIIGNNFNFGKIMGGNTAQNKSTTPGLPYTKATVYPSKDDPDRLFIKGWDSTGKDYPAVEITRERYDSLVKEGYSAVQIYHGMTEMQEHEENRSTGVSVNR